MSKRIGPYGIRLYFCIEEREIIAVNKIFKVFLKATDVIALCFLIPLFIGSLFVSRAVDFETIAEVTLETR